MAPDGVYFNPHFLSPNNILRLHIRITVATRLVVTMIKSHMGPVFVFHFSFFALENKKTFHSFEKDQIDAIISQSVNCEQRIFLNCTVNRVTGYRFIWYINYIRIEIFDFIVSVLVGGRVMTWKITHIGMVLKMSTTQVVLAQTQILAKVWLDRKFHAIVTMTILVWRMIICWQQKINYRSKENFPDIRFSK